MDKNILNFYDLHSPNDSIMYRAVLEKKDWMFRPLFFACDFHELVIDGLSTYPDLFGLMDQSLILRKLDLNPNDFVDHEKEINKINNAFNEKYRVRYCFDKIINNKNDGCFFLETDFTKLDKKIYNELVCNFYPCIPNIKDLDLFYDINKEIDLLKFPMLGEKGKWLFILEKDNFINDKLFIENCLKKIWYDSSKFDEEQINTILEIARANNIEAEDYNGK